jgi:CheY-like chemotaxis protein
MTDDDHRAFVAPDLQGMSVMIVAAAEIEASLLARRLGRWGARTCTAADEAIAFALLPERHWDTLLIDYPLIPAMLARGTLDRLGPARRIALIRPTERDELPALKAAGFTGYLVKPVRAVSLAGRLREDAFEHAPAEMAAESGAGAANPCKPLSILVAEDNEINALLARALLTRLGHRPTIAGSGEAAVESWLAARAAGAPFDLVLMDVQMPVMDGLEAARRIRAAEAESKMSPTRMVALTANAYPEDREAALEAGLNDLLVKPLDPERLRLAIEATPGTNAKTLAA